MKGADGERICELCHFLDYPDTPAVLMFALSIADCPICFAELPGFGDLPSYSCAEHYELAAGGKSLCLHGVPMIFSEPVSIPPKGAR